LPIIADLRINGRTVATVEIVNDGTGTDQRGTYDVLLFEGETRSRSLFDDPVHTKHGRVTFYDRKLGAVWLLKCALDALLEEEE
jgi:hypothetical protein